MTKIIATGQVEDAARWEQGFRTHGELFLSQTVNSPIHFNVSADNRIVICFEADDVDKFMELLDSRATEEAMAFDGVKRDSVKIVALDKEFDPLRS